MIIDASQYDIHSNSFTFKEFYNRYNHEDSQVSHYKKSRNGDLWASPYDGKNWRRGHGNGHDKKKALERLTTRRITMKTLALILTLFTAFAFSAECNQISDQIYIKFLCTDGKLITLHVNDIQDTYKVLNVINVTVDNKDGTYTITRHLSNFEDEKCKSKYLILIDVYDEFGIRIKGSEKCTNDASYSPTAVWNKLHAHNTFHKMTK